MDREQVVDLNVIVKNQQTSPSLMHTALASALVVSHASCQPACTDLLVAEDMKWRFLCCYVHMSTCFHATVCERFNGFHETATIPNAP